ncbi:hypothetical protein D9615_008324 [Tricholomella constricta]|uniref:Uncharacterized protein n=1 Tax=Tricholomella constricta TaxID=117010 RepID=A0A8H5HDM4_9AGAR|nr:hypothetical protein D9615_008324 [Tricholomella constricta]
MMTLLLVCKSSCEWITPLLYRSVTFWHAGQISKFYALHNVEEGQHVHFRHIQHLWIGSTPSHHRDLDYASSSWPITILDRIFNACSNLRSLYIIDIDQNQWYRLEDAIPGQLETLAMAPVHGAVRINEMKNKPRLRHFTTAHTFMRDNEIQDLVLSPHLETFRRLVASMQSQEVWGMDQTACVSEFKTLKEMQLVFYGTPATKLCEQEAKLRDITDDPRVVLSLSKAETWRELLYSEFQAEAEAHLSGLSRNQSQDFLYSTLAI